MRGALLFFLLLALGMLYLSWPTKESWSGYDAIMKQQEEKELEEEPIYRQARKGVRKELFSGPLEGRLAMRLTAKSSLLEMESSAGVPDLVEKFPHFFLIMQEKKFADEQLLRTLEAKEGTFSYFQEAVFATKARIARYKIAGEDLPEKVPDIPPLFQGIAAEVEVDLGEGVTFSAKQVKATLKTGEGAL